MPETLFGSRSDATKKPQTKVWGLVFIEVPSGLTTLFRTEQAKSENHPLALARYFLLHHPFRSNRSLALALVQQKTPNKSLGLGFY